MNLNYNKSKNILLFGTENINLKKIHFFHVFFCFTVQFKFCLENIFKS